MAWSMLQSWLLGRQGQKRNCGRRTRPGVEALEDRCVPAVITVNTLADTAVANDGRTSLREAIAQVNRQRGDDVIEFSVTGTINLKSKLPALGSNVELRGPGAGSAPGRPPPAPAPPAARRGRAACPKAGSAPDWRRARSA